MVFQAVVLQSLKPVAAPSDVHRTGSARSPAGNCAGQCCIPFTTEERQLVKYLASRSRQQLERQEQFEHSLKLLDDEVANALCLHCDQKRWFNATTVNAAWDIAGRRRVAQLTPPRDRRGVAAVELQPARRSLHSSDLSIAVPSTSTSTSTVPTAPPAHIPEREPNHIPVSLIAAPAAFAVPAVHINKEVPADEEGLTVFDGDQCVNGDTGFFYRAFKLIRSSLQSNSADAVIGGVQDQKKAEAHMHHRNIAKAMYGAVKAAKETSSPPPPETAVGLNATPTTTFSPAPPSTQTPTSTETSAPDLTSAPTSAPTSPAPPPPPEPPPTPHKPFNLFPLQPLNTTYTLNDALNASHKLLPITVVLQSPIEVGLNGLTVDAVEPCEIEIGQQIIAVDGEYVEDERRLLELLLNGTYPLALKVICCAAQTFVDI
jgi:hypothetical protein